MLEFPHNPERTPVARRATPWIYFDPRTQSQEAVVHERVLVALSLWHLIVVMVSKPAEAQPRAQGFRPRAFPERQAVPWSFYI
jgi:hypothetical protein